MNTEKKLYQWDTGQKLEGCTGLYVDFPIDDEVYRVETIDGMCIIPDELLQTSGSHKVYECMTNNTIRSFAFSVIPRPKPPEYVFTPTERLTFEGLVQKVDDAVADMIRRAESGEFDGHTPIKGTDYFTTAEIQQIQNEVSSGAIGEFKSVVDTETETFNTNAETKLNAYNENDVAKTRAYNTNASNKVTEYNTNANNRVAEFDTHTEQIQTDISELKSDLENLAIPLWEKSTFTYPNVSLQSIVKESRSSSLLGSTRVDLDINENFTSIYFYAKRDALIYLDPLSAPYVALIVAQNPVGDFVMNEEQTRESLSCDSAIRYRLSESNLPDAENPLSVGKGDLIVVTVTKAYDVNIFINDTKLMVGNNVLLNDNNIAQVAEFIGLKKPYIKYTIGSGDGNSTERFDIYMPTFDGYIDYQFVHTVNNADNADVWRLHQAYHADDYLTNMEQLTANGEWELALRLTDRDDFMGGYMHGDEIKTDFAVMIDGDIVTDFTNLSTVTQFETLIIYQTTNLIDPNDHITVVAVHGSEHEFNYKNNNSLIIRQSVKWLGDYSLQRSYMAMFPASKSETDTYLTDVGFGAVTINEYPIEETNVERLKIYKNNGKFSANFSIPKYPTIATNKYLLITDNNGNPYNKCYYSLFDVGSATNGDVWKSVTEYNLEYGKS